MWQSHVAFLHLLLTTMASSDPKEVFTIESVIRGHHVYKYVWTVLEREHHNSHDCYATTVMKDDVIVGRVPRVSKFPLSP